jgi:hypothetical protein
MRRNYVLAGLALIAAVAIASPALGGPSLKKLVKKEVTKQLAGKSGPQGTSGPQGPAGTNGTNGTNGQSVASANEPTGTGNCSGRGGSKFTAANGVTFACNGQSVTSANESTGTANCGGRGGSRFNSASGTTFACNGTNGSNGTNGATNVDQHTAALTVNAGQENSATAQCDTGEVATGGGYAQATLIDAANLFVQASRPAPLGTPTGWFVVLKNTSASQYTGLVFVICASP